jgi:ribonuclease T1
MWGLADGSAGEQRVTAAAWRRLMLVGAWVGETAPQKLAGQRWLLRCSTLVLAVWVAVVCAGVVLWPVSVQARITQEGTVAPADARTVALQQLPRQARETYQLILSGGPFPYEKDGTVFGNRERLLTRQPRGYYREYTVRTPGSRDRGARRLVCGGQRPTQPDACYYTDDHYASFRKVIE